MGTHGYDQSSGLVFAETVIGAPGKRDTQNLAKCLGRKPKYLPLPEGAHSLEAIAMRHLLCNLKDLDELSLITLPAALLEQIWTRVRRSQLDSLHIWRIFAASAIGNKSFIKSMVIQSKASKMESLINIAKSPSLSWLTNLVISVDGLEPALLTQIAKIDTLRRLHIAHLTSPRRARPVFEDRVFRSWAESAKSSGALSKLGILFVYQCPGFSNHSLALLKSFPALEEVCTYSCGMIVPTKSREREFGWRQSELSGFCAHVRSSRAYHHSSSGIGQPNWLAAADEYSWASRSESTSVVDDRPLLSLHMTGTSSGNLRYDIDHAVCIERCPVSETDEKKIWRCGDGAPSDERPAKKARIPRKLIRFEDTFGNM